MINHVGIVMDGNRRWAKSKNKKPWEGHREGAKTVDNLLNWAKELEIKELTLYTLSIENLQRDKKELDEIFSLFKQWFEKFRKEKRVKEDKIKIRFPGNLNLIPKEIREMAEEIEEETENHDNYIINFCFAYGGRQELLNVVNKLKSKKGEITEKDIEENLWLNSQPDIIIRTGGKTRTSNFLPWQSIYSEWFFLDKMWPEFNKEDLTKCIEKFNKTSRNFGK